MPIPFTNESQLIPQDEFAIIINPGQLIKYQYKDNNLTLAQNQTFEAYLGTPVVTGNSTQHLLHYTQGLLMNKLANIGNIQKDLDKLNVAQTHSDIDIALRGYDPLFSIWQLGFGQIAFTIGTSASKLDLLAHFNDTLEKNIILEKEALSFFPMITGANDTAFKAAILANDSVYSCALQPPFSIPNNTFNMNHSRSYCGEKLMNQTFVEPYVSALNETVYIFDQDKTYSMTQDYVINETESISNLNGTIVASAYEMNTDTAMPKIPFIVTESNGTYFLHVLQA